MAKRLPVTILTGFLGAGKTTLLNNLLTSLAPKDGGQPLRVAVIENEFAAAFGIENEIIDKKHVESLNELYEFGFGCVCCSSSGELLRVLQEIAVRQESEDSATLDWVILETTGLADPGPVVNVFLTNELVRESFYVDGVVTVLDAKHTLSRLATAPLSNYKNEPLAQILSADRIIINKVDLVDDGTLQEISTLVHQYNPTAVTFKTSFGKVGLSDILNVRTNSAGALPEESLKTHDPAIQPVAIFVEGEVDLEATLQFIRTFAAEHAKDLFRVKGVLAIRNDPFKFVVQGVVGDVEAWRHREWPADSKKDSRLTFIGRNMESHIDELRKAFEKCSVQ